MFPTLNVPWQVSRHILFQAKQLLNVFVSLTFSDTMQHANEKSGCQRISSTNPAMPAWLVSRRGRILRLQITSTRVRGVSQYSKRNVPSFLRSCEFSAFMMRRGKRWYMFRLTRGWTRTAIQTNQGSKALSALSLSSKAYTDIAGESDIGDLHWVFGYISVGCYGM